ncbi:hypothetical protein DXG01_006661 [Tephrocybe rancida]|nr:hypothetical protein DXG01_006661 [Tephrocybe rancida]
MKIANRTFIVSGGSSGLGLATVLDLLSFSAYIAILDRSAPPESASLPSSHTRYIQTDITEVSQIQAAVDATVQWAKETNAPLGGVINCAGVGTAAKILDASGEPHSLDLWDFAIAVNLTGSFNLSRLALPHLVKVQPEETEDGERGVIVFVSSAAAYEGQPGQTAYSATKGALRSMTLPMARDLARHAVRVVTIAPGVFASSMTAGMPQKTQRSLAKDGVVYPQRFGHPEEFARTVRWVLDCAYVNGETILYKSDAVNSFRFPLFEEDRVRTRILETLRPIFQVEGDASSKGLRAWRRKVEPCTEIRFVFSRWCQILTPLVIREVVLTAALATSLTFIAQFFDLRAGHIHTLMMFGNYSNDDSQSYRGVAEAVVGGLACCEKITSLQCLGSHPVFIHRGWMSTFSPNLASAVTSLVIVEQSSGTLPHALVDLGPFVQNLTIVSSSHQSGIPLSSFYMPSTFPHPKHLSYQFQFHEKTRPSKNLLQSLHLRMNWQFTPSTADILHLNDHGSKSTTLHLDVGQFHKDEPLLTKVLGVCHGLVEFSYISPFSKEALARLPVSIEDFIRNDEWGVTALDLVKAPRLDRSPLLHSQASDSGQRTIGGPGTVALLQGAWSLHGGTNNKCHELHDHRFLNGFELIVWS